jgi:hypothetical protein
MYKRRGLRVVRPCRSELDSSGYRDLDLRGQLREPNTECHYRGRLSNESASQAHKAGPARRLPR